MTFRVCHLNYRIGEFYPFFGEFGSGSRKILLNLVSGSLKMWFILVHNLALGLHLRRRNNFPFVVPNIRVRVGRLMTNGFH